MSALSFSSGKFREGPSYSPVQYKSRVRILVTPPAPKKNSEGGQEIRTWLSNGELLRKLTVSEDVLAKVAKALSLKGSWEELQGRINFFDSEEAEKWEQLGNLLLNIEVTGNTPEQSQSLADTLSRELIEYTQDVSAREITASRQQLEKSAVANKAKVEKIQQSILKWRQKNDIWDIDRLSEAQGGRISALESEARTQEDKLAELRRKEAQLSAFRANSNGDSLPFEVSPADLSKLNVLQEQLNQAEAELERKRSIFKEETTTVQEALAEYQEASGKYSQERRAAIESLLSQARIEVANAETALAKLKAEITSEKQNNGLAKAQVELQKMQYELETEKNNYQEVLKQIADVKVEEQAKKNEASFTILEKPAPGTPEGGVTPGHWNLNAIASFVILSLFGSIAMTVFIDSLWLDNRFKKRVEVLGLPILGVLPQLDEGAGHHVVLDQPRSIFAEQIRSLVINLKRLDTDITKILVTSCWPSEGKSLVSLSLAHGIARFGLTTYLIDGDLRRPFLTEWHEKTQSPGLRQYLNGDFPLDELTYTTSAGNVHFIPAGTGSDSPAELLANRKPLSQLAQGSEQRFLVIDSSPLSVCSDSIQLSDDVDGVLLVVNAKTWDGRGELEYVEELHERGVPVLGLVLNNVHAAETIHGYGKGYSGYYASYQKQDASIQTSSKVKQTLQRIFRR